MTTKMYKAQAHSVERGWKIMPTTQVSTPIIIDFTLNKNQNHAEFGCLMASQFANSQLVGQ